MRQGSLGNGGRGAPRAHGGLVASAAGAVAVVAAGGFRPGTVLAALGLLLLGAVLSKRDARRCRAAAAAQRERLERESAARAAEQAGNLDHLCSEVLPIWSGQIELARTHTETAVNGLAARLVGLHGRADALASSARRLAERSRGPSAGDVPQGAESAAGVAAEAESVSRAAHALSDEATAALMALQFQDRADQILKSVRGDQEKLQERLRRHGGANDARLRVDVVAWLAGLAQSYTMLEQRAVHEGQSADAAGEPGEIEFF